MKDGRLVALAGTANGFWEPTTLMEIASEAGKPVALDDFRSRFRKAGFSGLRVQLDSSEPLKPGVSIQSADEVFWQPLIYENVPGVCYKRARLGHVLDDCVMGREQTRLREKPLVPESFYASLMVVEGGNVERELQESSERPKLDPWLVTSQIWQPRDVRLPANARKDGRSNLNLSGWSSSPSQPSSPVPGVSSPGSPPDSDGWRKPTKVARRCSPEKKVDSDPGGGKVSEFRK